MSLIYDRTIIESLRQMKIQYRMNENFDQSLTEEMTNDEFNDMLDTMYEPYVIHGVEFKPSDVLWALDPEKYKTLKQNFNNDTGMNEMYEEKPEDEIKEETEISLRDGTGPHGKRNRKETESCPYDEEKSSRIDEENEFYSIEEMVFMPSDILFNLNKKLYKKY